MIQGMVEDLSEYGVIGLFILSFAESFFFPIPPDLILIPLAMLNPGNALSYAAITTVASILGGVFGYFLGLKAGRPILERYISRQRIEQVDSLFINYGGWAVAVAGFTPIPYKVFTIASGISRINLSTFIIASFLGRGARFFSLGIIIQIFGQEAQFLFETYFNTVSIVVTLVLISCIFIWKWWQKRTYNKSFPKSKG